MDEQNAEKDTSLERTSIPSRSWPGASLYKSLKLGWHWRRLRWAVVAASEAAQGHEANGLPLLMYVVIWLTSPYKNKTTQVSAAFASILAITHLAGVVFEAVAVLGVFAVDLLTGQVVARMDKRERNKLAKSA